MAITIQLLKQLRAAAADINGTATDPTQQMQLTAMDSVLNELMLQESPSFYLDYIASGRVLLEEGMSVAACHGAVPVLPHELRDDLSAELRAEVLNDEIDRLHECQQLVVKALDEARSGEEKDYLVRLADWDVSLYRHRLEQPGGEPTARSRGITRESLQAYLENKYPQWVGLQVLQFAPLDGGFSKKTILFETEDELNGKQSLVMRAEQSIDILGYDGSDVTLEYATIHLMRNAGLPVAEPLWLESDRSKLGHRFIVSRKAQGRTYGGNFGSEEPLPPALVENLMANFIRLHNVRIDFSDPLVQESHLQEWQHCRTVSEATLYLVTEFLQRSIRRNDVSFSPQLQRGLNWLKDNIPDCDETPAVVHIDYAFNNLIIEDNRVIAILDWESSRMGDPAEDIVWTQGSLAPHISMDEFLRQYKAGTGRDISAYRLAYNRVAKCALNAISCLSAMRGLDRHDDAQINASVLGFKYMALFGTQFNELIEGAEKARGT